jgi:uncharacterized membrane protein YhaH (DUF805 family)
MMREIGYVFAIVLNVAAIILVGAIANLEGYTEFNTIAAYFLLFLPVVVILPSLYLLVRLVSKSRRTHRINLDSIFLFLFGFGFFGVALYYYLHLANTENSFDEFVPIAVNALSAHLGATLGALRQSSHQI